MFAVIKTGGKQYRVAAQDVLTIEKLVADAGDVIAFDQVLMVGDAAGTAIGTPTVAGAIVAAEVVEQTRGDKVITFKKRRRKNSRRKEGHRQDLTVVKITEILTGGAKPSKALSPSRAVEVQPAPAVALVDAAATVAADDIELIAGIGAALKKKLVAAGISSWKQIAAWTDEDLAKYDGELGLRGRAKREEWVEQARDLLAGKPPRAQVDQDKAD